MDYHSGMRPTMNDTPRVLMILTKDRRDCVDISLQLHERGGSFEVFNRVVFLLNDVTAQHMRFIDRWIARHPHVSCDKILGDGTRPQGIAAMQNRCIERYPGGFYAKTDEDVFVPGGWARMMWEAYEANRHREDLALITPLLPNNSYGLYVLLNVFYPELLDEHRRLFGTSPTPDRCSPTWHNPRIAHWATTRFLDLEQVNREQRERLERVAARRPAASGLPQQTGAISPGVADDVSITLPYTEFTLRAGAYHPFSIPFSIGCIGYDYRHWKNMGGIPWNDEPGWCQWIEENRQTCILDCRQIALHYTFFVQQRWLDRSPLIEDIRKANLADTVRLSDRAHLHRAARIVNQSLLLARERLKKTAAK